MDQVLSEHEKSLAALNSLLKILMDGEASWENFQTRISIAQYLSERLNKLNEYEQADTDKKPLEEMTKE